MATLQIDVRLMCGVYSVMFAGFSVCVCVLCVGSSLSWEGFGLCYVRSVVGVMCSRQSVSCTACSHGPRRFVPSMPRSAQ